MASTVVKTASPPYVDYSPRVDDLLSGIQSPPSPLRLTNHTRPTSPNSMGEGYSPTRPSFRGTDTQDLAEFLKTSSPNDFRKALKGSPSDEQAFSLGSTYKKGIKFLRTSSSRPKLGSSGASLPTVQAKTTSRGKPYLQIHVDYDNNSIQTYRSTSGEEATISSCSQSEGPSDSAHPDISNSAGSPRPLTADSRPCLNPATWNTLGTPRAESLTNYRLDNSPGGEEEIKEQTTTPTEATSGERLKRQKNRPTLLTSPPRSPTDCSRSNDVEMYLSSPNNSIPVKVKSRSSSLRRTKRSRAVSARSSANSDEIMGPEKDDPNALQRKKDRKTPPRPGPPPARSLPALPESHDTTLGLISPTSRPRDSLISSSDSVISTTSGLSRRKCSTDSGKSREEKVKARKAWDMQQARLRRQSPQEKPRSASTPGSGISSPRTHENGLPQAPGLERVSSALARVPSDRNDRVISHQLDAVVMTPGSLTPPYSPVPHLDPMMSPRTMSVSSTIASRAPCGSENYMSERELALESRLIAIERKNRMLEQTLIAVIRGSVSNGHRWSELQRTNALEDFLRELKTIDTGPPPSAAFLSKSDNQCY
ncbi:hypothetical protein EDC01DRAFT_626812 [Geopyxis carbonaria]|nr:hypothetical protein EDC01DRAFT_626812 [Geopyxis carbonaria]